MAEKEYIERSELIRYAEVELRMQGDLFRRAVESCPTADVVEVVRCRDCAYWAEKGTKGTIGRCKSPRNGLFYEYTDKLDYCSYGERRADNG